MALKYKSTLVQHAVTQGVPIASPESSKSKNEPEHTVLGTWHCDIFDIGSERHGAELHAYWGLLGLAWLHRQHLGTLQPGVQGTYCLQNIATSNQILLYDKGFALESDTRPEAVLTEYACPPRACGIVLTSSQRNVAPIKRLD